MIRRSMPKIGSRQRANNNILLASLIWGLGLRLAVWAACRMLPAVCSLDLFTYAGVVILVLVLYPALVTLKVRRKAHLWVNALLFSALGSMMSDMLILAASGFLSQDWFNVVTGVLGIVLFGLLLVPRFERIPVVQREWDAPLWERLNGLSLVEFLLFRFSSLDDAAF